MIRQETSAVLPTATPVPDSANPQGNGVFERTGTPVMIKTSSERANEISSSSFTKLEPSKETAPENVDIKPSLSQKRETTEEPPKETNELKKKSYDMPIGEFLRMFPDARPGKSEL